MDEEAMDFNVICRTCLSSDNELSIMDSNIINMLKSCISTEMNIDDLPKHICSICKDLLGRFFKFKQECHRSEEILLNKLLNKSLQTVELKKEPIMDQSFNCDNCKEVFLNEENYMCHLRKHEELDTTFEQYLVKKEEEDDVHHDDFMNESDTNEVSISEPFQEDFTSFSSENQLSPLKHKCTQCRQSFDVKFDLGLHGSTDAANGIYKCPECTVIYASVDSTTQPKKKRAKTKEEIKERKRIAERLRYHRLKNDPEKKEEMKEKQRLRYQREKENGKRKLVKDMNPREYKAAKKKWKENCAAYRARKKFQMKCPILFEGQASEKCSEL